MSVEESVEERVEKLPLVYVGPTSPRLGLVQWNQYIGLNDNIKAAIEKFPALDMLFIPLEEFGPKSRDIFSRKDASVNHIIKSLAKKEVF
jgi:hypothetical protein